MFDINRRQFVSAAAAGVFLGILGTEISAAPSAGTVDVGTLADYPQDGIFDAQLKPARILMIRSGNRIFAASATCTHKGCAVKIRDGKIKCPCHSSSFSDEGKPMSGPARASLFRFAISTDDKGHLIVDKSKQFGEREWDDPQAWVSVKSAA